MRSCEKCGSPECCDSDGKLSYRIAELEQDVRLWKATCDGQQKYIAELDQLVRAYKKRDGELDPSPAFSDEPKVSLAINQPGQIDHSSAVTDTDALTMMVDCDGGRWVSEDDYNRLMCRLYSAEQRGKDES